MNEANRDQTLARQQELANERIAEQERLAQAGALGYNDFAAGMLKTQAELELERQRIMAAEQGRYGTNVTGAISGNANRLTDISQTEGAGYMSAISSGLGSFGTFYDLASQRKDQGDTFGDKWGTAG